MEISKKYPGDCNDACKIAMLKYWLHAARRTGRVFLYMAHHHLLLYEGTSCYQLTRAFFHYALAEMPRRPVRGHGHVAGPVLGTRAVPRAPVGAPAPAGESVTVENTGTANLNRLPLEIALSHGRRFMTLVDVPAGTKTVVRVG